MKKSLLLAGLLPFALQSAFAWDYEGHRLVNDLALSSLPTNFPVVITPELHERVLFLAGEPDRWRNTPDLSLQHQQEPEHFFDLEELPHVGLTPETLPIFRYDFVSLVTAARKAHPEAFPAGTRDDPARKYIWTGLLPWTITENYAKLKSEFSYLKTFQMDGGTPEEIANAQANIIYTMGVMGHYVGDAAQPLHTTVYHHGWTGENPHHYTTNNTFHGWIDGGFIAKANVPGDLEAMKKKIRAAQVVMFNGQQATQENFFKATVAFLVEQNKLVEPLYQLDAEHKLSGNGELGTQGKPFIEGQLIKGGQLLGDIWYSAWQESVEDTFLKRQLEKRNHAAH